MNDWRLPVVVVMIGFAGVPRVDGISGWESNEPEKVTEVPALTVRHLGLKWVPSWPPKSIVRVEWS